ncbi:hypothetical protein FPV67DRAFT_1460827 [Lyophyllum atratum]|nr:hypothetical protein FPV67DRAFT_1460827 [Lyophyllum atratum]
MAKRLRQEIKVLREATNCGCDLLKSPSKQAFPGARRGLCTAETILCGLAIVYIQLPPPSKMLNREPSKPLQFIQSIPSPLESSPAVVTTAIRNSYASPQRRCGHWIDSGEMYREAVRGMEQKRRRDRCRRNTGRWKGGNKAPSVFCRCQSSPSGNLRGTHDPQYCQAQETLAQNYSDSRPQSSFGTLSLSAAQGDSVYYVVRREWHQPVQLAISSRARSMVECLFSAFANIGRSKPEKPSFTACKNQTLSTSNPFHFTPFLSFTMLYFTTQHLRLPHPVYGQISPSSIILAQLAWFTPNIAMAYLPPDSLDILVHAILLLGTVAYTFFSLPWSVCNGITGSQLARRLTSQTGQPLETACMATIASAPLNFAASSHPPSFVNTIQQFLGSTNLILTPGELSFFKHLPLIVHVPGFLQRVGIFEHVALSVYVLNPYFRHLITACVGIPAPYGGVGVKRFAVPFNSIGIYYLEEPFLYDRSRLHV